MTEIDSELGMMGTENPRRKKREYKPDSCAAAIDGVRALAVVCMFCKSFIQRMTISSNPMTKALGYEWIPSAFAYAGGARLTAELNVLSKNLKDNWGDHAKCRELRFESYIKSLFKNFLIFVYACLLLIIAVSHKKLCMWDILQTICISGTIMYPIIRYVPLWIPLAITPVIFIFTPVIFDKLDGASHYGEHGYISDFKPAHLLGSLFFYGATPVFPYLGIHIWGAFVSSRTICEPVATNRKRGFYAFVGLIFVMVGIELQQVYYARGPFENCVAKYIFTKISFTPVSFSWALILSGANTVAMVALAVIFDPLAPELKAMEKRKERLKEEGLEDIAEPVIDWFKDFFYRGSRWTMSMYIWHGILITVPLRIVGAAKYDDEARFIDSPQLVWTNEGEAVIDTILIIAGFLYFWVFYGVFYVWEIYGKGKYTLEFFVGKFGELGWWIFGRYFKKKSDYVDSDREDGEEEEGEESSDDGDTSDSPLMD